MRKKNKWFVTITAANDINDLKGKWPVYYGPVDGRLQGTKTMSLVFFAAHVRLLTLSISLLPIHREFLLSKLTDIEVTKQEEQFSETKIDLLISRGLLEMPSVTVMDFGN